MKSITRFAAVLVALLTFWSHAAAQTTLPLNTGYNHPSFTTYPVGASDNYWINIASYPGGSTAIGPSRVIPQGGWATPLPGPAAFPGTAWISGWPGSGPATGASPAGTSANNPAYTIFRKCFCLLPGFKEARLSFRTRADDSIQVWFNTQLNQLLAPSVGNFMLIPPLPPLSGGTDKGFRVGKNCLYALVEDTGGAMGFNMDGTVSAYGLLPTPAAGAGQSFAPCACETGHPGTLDAASPRDAASVLGRRAAVVEEDEKQVIDAIIKVAEARRLERQRQR